MAVVSSAIATDLNVATGSPSQGPDSTTPPCTPKRVALMDCISTTCGDSSAQADSEKAGEGEASDATSSTMSLPTTPVSDMPVEAASLEVEHAVVAGAPASEPTGGVAGDIVPSVSEHAAAADGVLSDDVTPAAQAGAEEDDVAVGATEQSVLRTPRAAKRARALAPKTGHRRRRGIQQKAAGGAAGKEPSRPRTAFFCFLEAVRAALVEELGTSKPTDVARQAGERWRALSADDKAPYEQKAAELRAAYDSAMEAFLANGGVRSTRKRARQDAEPLGAAAQPSSPSRSLESGAARVPEEQATPEKRRRPAETRAVAHAGIHVVQGLSEHNTFLDDGERLLVRRDKRQHKEPDAMAVFDGSLGCHVGSLSSAVSELLAPLLDAGSRGLRVRGRVPAGAKASRQPDSGSFDVRIELSLSAPAEMGAEMAEAAEKLRACGIGQGDGDASVISC